MENLLRSIPDNLSINIDLSKIKYIEFLNGLRLKI